MASFHNMPYMATGDHIMRCVVTVDIFYNYQVIHRNGIVQNKRPTLPTQNFSLGAPYYHR